MTPAPAHAHGQGEICDADCPHWQWAEAAAPSPVEPLDMLRLVRAGLEPIADGLDADGQGHWADALRETWRQTHDKIVAAARPEAAQEDERP